MAKSAKPAVQAAAEPGGGRRKLIAFDTETWQALDLLGRDTFMTLQELADEAFRDLLRKHNRPLDLRDALKKSARGTEAVPRKAGKAGRKRP
jgi:hypothetical protein